MRFSSSCRITHRDTRQPIWYYTEYAYHLLQISKDFFLLPCFFVLLGQSLLSSVFFYVLLSLIFIRNRLLVITQKQLHLSSQGSCHACLGIDPCSFCLMVLTSVTPPALSSYFFVIFELAYFGLY